MLLKKNMDKLKELNSARRADERYLVTTRTTLFNIIFN